MNNLYSQIKKFYESKMYDDCKFIYSKLKENKPRTFKSDTKDSNPYLHRPLIFVIADIF